MNTKTLWISDLDGTLLNKDKKITSVTKNILNKAIAEGEHFTVATARTPGTVVDMLEGVNVNVPAVVMNGGAIYNLATERYEHAVLMAPELVACVQDVLSKYNKNAFIYTIEQHKLVTYYQELANKHEQLFYEERMNNTRKTFVQGIPPVDAKVIHFAIMGDGEVIEQIAKDLEIIKGIAKICSRDVYDENTYYLEVYSEKVSKASAIEYVKEHYGFDRVICFGDNVNDLEMFGLADEKYAVANALDEVKELATAVIGHHNEDGVAKFIEEKRKK